MSRRIDTSSRRKVVFKHVDSCRLAGIEAELTFLSTPCVLQAEEECDGVRQARSQLVLVNSNQFTAAMLSRPTLLYVRVVTNSSFPLAKQNHAWT